MGEKKLIEVLHDPILAVFLLRYLIDPLLRKILNLDLIGYILKNIQPASIQNGLVIQILGLFLKYLCTYF